MPLPISLVLMMTVAAGAAYAGREELRGSLRHVLLSRTFGAFLSYALFVLVPASAYFYVVHGDWSLLYLVDVELIPSAIALLAFIAQLGLGIAFFSVSASMVRTQRSLYTLLMIGGLLLIGAFIVTLAAGRLSVVGTYAQYHAPRQFQLSPYLSGAMLRGIVAIGGLSAIGLITLLLRLSLAGRRA